MQAAKDSFYLTLRDRLAASYPDRTITVGAGTRPAIVVVENDKPSVTARQHEAFYVEWGEARPVSPAISTLDGNDLHVFVRERGDGAERRA